MTLVVARIQKGRIAVVSDTQLTEHGKPLPPQSGVIKTFLLPGDLCVSFSNSPELAASAFRRFQTKYPRGANFAEAVAFFEASSVETGNEYILAFFPTAKLVKIVDGKRVQSLANTVWIGDKFAYERFREYQAHARPFPQHGRAVNSALFMDEMGGSPASDLFSSMRNVILDNQISSVGGFAYTVSSRDNGYRQSVYCDILHNWPHGLAADFKFCLNDPIDFGASGENFEYSIAQISPGYIGVNLAGFYLVKAKKLFFFCGMQNGLPDRCQVFNNVEPSNIKHILTAALGVDLNWLVTVASSAPNKTETQFTPRTIDGPQGARLSFFIHENSFPKQE